MSAIDTFNHAHVGNFFNIPIYWIFEENSLSRLTDNSNDKNIIIDQSFLSIGGGSGEHPALIFQNDAVIFQFLKNIQEIPKPNEKSNSSHIFHYDIFIKSEHIQELFYNEYAYWNIDQNQWPLESFIDVYKKLNRIQKSSTPLTERIQNVLAMFIIYEMPLDHCLKNQELISIAKMIR